MRHYVSVMCVLAITIAQLDGQTRTTAATGDTKQGGIVGAQSPQVWRMTDEDRIARRVALLVVPPRARSTAVQSGSADVIDGREHPELFLPYELFDFLAVGVEPTRHGAYVRQLLDPKVHLLGYTSEQFWNVFATVAHPYMEAQKTAKERGSHSSTFVTSSGEKLFVPVNRDICAERIRSLNDARTAFGREQFDRFLYTAVASEAASSFAGNVPNRSEQLRYMARGCK